VVTGSRIPAKDCRTKEEWAKNGLVIQGSNSEKLASK
jgi:hypothetical protein